MFLALLLTPSKGRSPPPSWGRSGGRWEILLIVLAPHALLHASEIARPGHFLELEDDQIVERCLGVEEVHEGLICLIEILVRDAAFGEIRVKTRPR